jgi:hypothetical protein
LRHRLSAAKYTGENEKDTWEIAIIGHPLIPEKWQQNLQNRSRVPARIRSGPA